MRGVVFLWSTVFLLCCELFHLSTSAANGADCECGIENVGKFKIVGGKEVNPPNRYPWLASLVRNEADHFCGAAVINNFYVLTASHCFETLTASEVKVALGAHNLSTFNNYLPVEKVIKHENYSNSEDGVYHDVTLLKLKDEIIFSRNVSPVCLPPPAMVSFTNLTVAGWGSTFDGGSANSVPLEVNLPYVTYDECFEFHGPVVTANHVCAGGKQGEDSCGGDSGGPLITRYSERAFEVGVVSYGIGCGMAGYYGVYARVTDYMPWILHNTLDAKYCTKGLENIISTITTTVAPTTSPTTTTTASTASPATSKPTVATVPSITTASTPTIVTTASTPTIVTTALTPTIVATPPYPNMDDCGLMQPFENSSRSSIVVVLYREKILTTGVLISPNFVLTTAAELAKYLLNPARFSVVIQNGTARGSNVLGNTVKVKSISVHPKYGKLKQYDFNFGLLQLDMETSQNVLTICLPPIFSKFYDSFGVKVVSASVTSEGGLWVQQRVFDAKLVNRVNCAVRFPAHQISSTLICAQIDSMEQNLPVNGVVYQKLDGRNFVIGFVSSRINHVFGKVLVLADARLAVRWIYKATFR